MQLMCCSLQCLLLEEAANEVTGSSPIANSPAPFPTAPPAGCCWKWRFCAHVEPIQLPQCSLAGLPSACLVPAVPCDRGRDMLMCLLDPPISGPAAAVPLRQRHLPLPD
ncbi:hypothetical protein KIL84_020672 [Mauremys mutica]|uniref:Uncharacterized protein n=1 Tax=Mauremys mutica TaxID=74926 RepID=A0A9D3XAB7_9SAUR|nr:hypothetical protein KIL84_020672 [Mauremys mutica]